MTRTMFRMQDNYTRWRKLYEKKSTGPFMKVYCRYKMWRARLRISSLEAQTTEDDGY